MNGTPSWTVLSNGYSHTAALCGHTARQVHLQRRLQLQTIFESLEKLAQTSNKRGTNLECRIFVHIA